MAIKKQEFYEGAALHALARSQRRRSYDRPMLWVRVLLLNIPILATGC